MVSFQLLRYGFLIPLFIGANREDKQSLLYKAVCFVQSIKQLTKLGMKRSTFTIGRRFCLQTISNSISDDYVAAGVRFASSV